MFARNGDTLKYIFLIGILCIGITGCGNTDRQSAAERPKAEISSITKSLTDGEEVEDVVDGELAMYTPSAAIDYVETSMKQQNNELFFGNLSMELPDGVTAA